VHGLLVTRSFGDLKARLPELGGTADGIINEPFMQVLDVDTSVVSSIFVCADGKTDPQPPSAKQSKNFMCQYLKQLRRNKNSTRMNKPGTIIKINTSNVGKYSVGQEVRALGLGKHSGTILSVEADSPGMDTGPGILSVEIKSETIEDEACRVICEAATSARYWEGKSTEADNATVVFVGIS
jgi:hypothetical protein